MLKGDVEGVGLGVILGLPTGLSVAWRPGGPLYYDGAVAWSFSRGSLAVHADALVQLADMKTEDIPDTSFPLYVGVGPRIRIGDVPGDTSDSDFDLGVRIPLGMAVYHYGTPIDGFLEIAPGIGFFPETAVLFDIAVGARFYLPR